MMIQRVEAGWLHRRLEEDGPVVVNVLDEDAFRQGHIPGSVNVPLSSPDFERRIQEAAPDRDKPVVVHCSGPSCPASGRAARRLEALGYRTVDHFAGGMEGWRKAGYPVEGEAERHRAPSEEGTAAEA